MKKEPNGRAPVERGVIQHTPGPWRWEFNRQSKVLHLVGGRPQYGLTIMDFDRYRAVATLRDTSEDGMNIMHRLCDRPDWIAPFPGRAHHADWCAAVTHPDMRLLAAAPDLLEALQYAVAQVPELTTVPGISAAITKAVGRDV